MTPHLTEIAAVAPDAHAVLLLDQVGWHRSAGLVVPGNITLLPLPAKCPELNPVENVWQFMRDNWLSNRIFKSYNDILDQCCVAWNRRRSAMAHHVHRTAPMGASVTINESWY